MLKKQSLFFSCFNGSFKQGSLLEDHLLFPCDKKASANPAAALAPWAARLLLRSIPLSQRELSPGSALQLGRVQMVIIALLLQQLLMGAHLRNALVGKCTGCGRSS